MSHSNITSGINLKNGFSMLRLFCFILGALIPLKNLASGLIRYTDLGHFLRKYYRHDTANSPINLKSQFYWINFNFSSYDYLI